MRGNIFYSNRFETEKKLLSKLLLILIGCGTGSSLLQLVFVPNFLSTFIVIMCGMGSLSIAYVMNARGRKKAGILLTIGVTVAEWVEDAETLVLLRDMGIDLVQGYFLGKPEPLWPV